MFTPHKSQYVTIVKRDDSQQIIEGYASSEDIDLQGGTWKGIEYVGDVVATEAIEKALPEYMEYGNIHEMHRDDSAAGVILSARVVKGVVELPNGNKITNPLKVVAHIVDPVAWQKVVTGVYKGLSIQADVFQLRLVKMANQVVRLIESIRLTEISLVDRPANPGAKIILWKGAGMINPKGKISKAADPMKAVGMLQELRDACELAGDLEKANSYSDAIALALQANGAGVSTIAEDASEAMGEHAALGEDEQPLMEEAETTMDTALGEEPASEEEKTAALDGLESEQEEEPAEEEEESGEEEDDEEEEEEETKKSLKSNPVRTPIRKSIAAQITKAELTSINKRLDSVVTALTGDIARIAKAYEDLAEQVDGMKTRPVMRELPWPQQPGGVPADQPVEILKGLRDDPTTDASTREALNRRITEMEIRAAQSQPNFIGFIR